MTFGSFGGFIVDFVGPAGDLMYGQNDNFYDPCAVKVTVGVGEKVPVVVRASGAVVVGVGVGIGQVQPVENTVVQVTAQNVSIGIAQPGGASNPIRQTQSQNLTQPQTIAVSPTSNETLKEFTQNGQSAGVTLLTPKALVEANQAGKVVQQLGQQIAVEVNSTRQTAQLLSHADDVVLQLLANQLRANQANLQQVLQKAGVGFEQINDIKNAMFSSDNALLRKALQKVRDKAPQITKTLQTAASNVAVRVCG